MQRDIAYEFVPSSPREFASCHASTLLPLPDGRLLAAWFGGTHEKHPDVAIWSSCRHADGSWTTPAKIADEPDLPHWNPVLADGGDDSVVLFYKVGPNCREWRTRTKHSADGGATWGTHDEPSPLSDAAGRAYPVGPVRNNLIVLSDGTWLAPTSRETETEWDAAVTLSRDRGRTWELATIPLDHGTFAGKGVIQPTAWESEPGRVHVLLRSTAGFVARSDSSDGGRTWSPVQLTDLPNNNSGIDLASLPGGALILCSNPVGADWGARTPLVLSRSNDNGRTWRRIATLEDEGSGDEACPASAADRERTEFSYPAIVAAGGEDVVVSYTWKRERIRVAWVRCTGETHAGSW